MDRPRVGDQHHAESDGANTEISNSRAFMGIGGKDEEVEGQTLEFLISNFRLIM